MEMDSRLLREWKNHNVQGQPRRRAKGQGENNLHHRLHQHRHHADGPALQRLRHAEGGGEQHQPHGVVNGHHHQKEPGHRAVGFVLPDHHQRGGGSGGGGDGAQGDGGGDGDDLRADQVQRHQSQVHQGRGGSGLEDAHHDGLAAHGFQLAETELVANGEGDKAQGHLGENIQALHRLHGGKSDAAQVQRADAEGPQQQSRHQIGGDGGQGQALGRPGQKQPSDEGGG